MQLSSSRISRTLFLLVGLLCFAATAAPSAGDFSISVNPPSLLIAIQNGDGFPFGEADGTLTLTALNGFSGNVELSCSVSGTSGPDQPTCFFPSTFPADQVFVDATNPPVTTGIEVDSLASTCEIPDNSSAPINFPRHPGTFAGAVLAFVVLALSAGVAWRLPNASRAKILRIAFIFAAGLAMAGCSDGPSAANTEGCPPGQGFTAGTPAGTYMVTVTTTSGNLSHSVTIPVTVPAQ